MNLTPGADFKEVMKKVSKGVPKRFRENLDQAASRRGTVWGNVLNHGQPIFFLHIKVFVNLQNHVNYLNFHKEMGNALHRSTGDLGRSHWAT
jgi:hypothetical protein